MEQIKFCSNVSNIGKEKTDMEFIDSRATPNFFDRVHPS